MEQGLGEADGWREDCNQTPAQHPAHNREGHSCVVFIFDFITEPHTKTFNIQQKQEIRSFVVTKNTFFSLHFSLLSQEYFVLTFPRHHVTEGSLITLTRHDQRLPEPQTPGPRLRGRGGGQQRPQPSLDDAGPGGGAGGVTGGGAGAGAVDGGQLVSAGGRPAPRPAAPPPPAAAPGAGHVLGLGTCAELRVYHVCQRGEQHQPQQPVEGDGQHAALVHPAQPRAHLTPVISTHCTIAGSRLTVSRDMKQKWKLSTKAQLLILARSAALVQT